MGSVKETRKNKKRLSRVLINSIQHYAIGARIPAAAKIPFLIKYAVKNRRKLSRFKSVSLHFSICCTAAGLACTSEGFTLKIFLQSCQVEVSDFIICLSKMECNRKPQNDRNDKSLWYIWWNHKTCNGSRWGSSDFRCVKEFRQFNSFSVNPVCNILIWFSCGSEHH